MQMLEYVNYSGSTLELESLRYFIFVSYNDSKHRSTIVEVVGFHVCSEHFEIFVCLAFPVEYVHLLVMALVPTQFVNLLILSRMWVTIDGLCFADWIYSTLIDTTRNYKRLQRPRSSAQFTNHHSTHKAFSSFLCLQPFPGNGHSSASRPQVLSSQSPVQNSTDN
jgi:hypothetical protein